MSASADIETPLHRFRLAHGKVVFEETPRPRPVPRLARSLALGHYLTGLVEQGVFRDYSLLAEWMKVSQPRISALVALSLLAPEIQEALLLGKCTVRVKALLAISRRREWEEQRVLAMGLGIVFTTKSIGQE